MPASAAGPAAAHERATQAQAQALAAYLEHDAQPAIVLDTAYSILAANTAYRRQFATADQPLVAHKCRRVSHHVEGHCDQAGERRLHRGPRAQAGPGGDGRGRHAFPRRDGRCAAGHAGEAAAPDRDRHLPPRGSSESRQADFGLVADDGLVRAEHLPALRGGVRPQATPTPARRSAAALQGAALDAALRRLMAQGRGTRRELAARLGLSERTPYRRLKALALA